MVMQPDLQELEAELAWFTRVLDLRFRRYFAGTNSGSVADTDIDPLDDVPPDLSASISPYATFVREHAASLPARLALVLALVPPLRPQLLDVFFTKNATFDRRFTEFGGQRTDDDFEPTGETLAFVLGGGSVAARVLAAQTLDPRQGLWHSGALAVAGLPATQPLLKVPLRLSRDHLALFTTGERLQPALSADFPAQRIQTDLEWDDLILHPATLQRILEVQTFIEHGHTLMHNWGMAARLRPGLRALFHGPPGTGKTMSAALLGKHTGHEVYRIDLSLVVSKYIGETEKNLSRVFDQAQRRKWILFFDEADALFGKRSETKDAHDRYANQEVAYLLQRIETFDGIAILASNLRENLDDAFARRFELVVYFPIPRAAERLRLWQRAWPAKAQQASDVNLAAVARDHELSGGAIMNVIRQVGLTAIADGGRKIAQADLVQAIRREMQKDGDRV
jgi:hypothetical protein